MASYYCYLEHFVRGENAPRRHRPSALRSGVLAVAVRVHRHSIVEGSIA